MNLLQKELSARRHFYAFKHCLPLCDSYMVMPEIMQYWHNPRVMIP